MQAEISRRERELLAEEENLKAKEKELSDVRSELEAKTNDLLEEQESLRTREREMASRLEREYKERAQDFISEEEEKLKVREQEIMKLQEEANVKADLYDEAQEKLKRKEEELSTLKGELEAEIRQRLQEEEKAALAKAASRKDAERRVERVLFPFSAIVGQEVMKKALILNAINPEIGGVLVPGQKGTGKSVTVRALAEILPDIKVSRDCRYNCDPDDVENLCDECSARHKAGKLDFYTRQTKVVDLPLNITEDRLVGSIDIEKVLSAGVKAFEPGLLAEVHRGILYVDEINLLDDYIVDILLDSAASGMVNVEREGISIVHPAKFIIIGSMNPEEGELRPQLLDRLALQVEITGITDISQRIEIVNHREDFTTSPVKFREKFEPQQKELRDRIKRAKEILPDVTTSPEILEHIARLCVDFNVDGHRADIIIERTARANAAYEGRLDVTRQDVEIAALMAFPHRMRLPPAEMEEFDLPMIKRVMDGY
jgi:magnesium chelatase subunit I